MAIVFNIPSQIEKYLSVAFFPATGNDFTLYIANDTNRLYQWDGAAYIEVSQQDAVNWGSIGGDIINQTDLQLALAGKENTITPGTTSQYFRGDKTFQTLDKAAVGLGNVDNTSDANKPISTATQTALNAKQNTLSLTTTGDNGASTLVGSTLNVPNYTLSGLGGVPTSRTLTINGVTQDLSADRTFTISTATPTLDQVTTAGNTTTNRITIGGATTNGSVTASGLIARGNFFNNTLVASANNDVLVGLDIQPTFTNGAFTGVKNLSIRVGNSYAQYTSTLGHGVELNTNVGILGSLDLGGDSSVLYLWRSGARANGAVIGSTYVSPNFRHIYFGTPPSKQMILSNATGNLLIGTTTDAGFRLDVNGTARVVNNILSGNGTYFTTGSQSIASASTANAFMEISSGASSSGSLVWSKAGSLSTLWQLYSDSSNNIAFFRNGVNREIFKIFESTKNVGIDETSGTASFTDITSAKLFVNSTTKGFLPPRMTQAQRNAIASPAIGLEIYQTDATEGKYIYKSSGWTYIG